MQVWNHSIDVANWPRWQEPYGTCCLEGGFISGGKVLVWDKKGNSLVPTIVITKVEPHHLYVMEEDIYIVKQLIADSFEPLSEYKTKVTRCVKIIGPLAF